MIGTAIDDDCLHCSWLQKFTFFLNRDQEHVWQTVPGWSSRSQRSEEWRLKEGCVGGGLGGEKDGGREKRWRRSRGREGRREKGGHGVEKDGGIEKVVVKGGKGQWERRTSFGSCGDFPNNLKKYV